MADDGTLSFGYEHGLSLGDMIFAASGNKYRVACVVSDTVVRVRPARWYDRLVMWWIGR